MFLSKIRKFEFVCAKNDFDILSKHCYWNHIIGLTPEAEPKLSKIYPLSHIEQIEQDAFTTENLCTDRI